MYASDVLGRYCGFWQAWSLVKPLFFWIVDTFEHDVKVENIHTVYKKAKVKGE
jgi:hypothetical protein